LSPDLSIRLEWLVDEWSSSLWTHAPRVTDVATGRILLDLWGTSWDAQTAWIGDNGLRLDLRRYDRAGAITVLLDPSGGTYRIGADGRACPLTDVRQGMNDAFGHAHRHYLDSLAIRAAAPGLSGLDVPVGHPTGADPVGDGAPPRGRPFSANIFAILRRAVSAAVTGKKQT
jgi:hypothetical protein